MDVVRPQVVAHRGASHDNAEHTLRAYVAALDAGAEALECDVRLTADGHLVCVHDRDLRRTASSRTLISNTELADLDQLDFHSWKNPWADLDDEAPDPDDRLDKVLTLRTLLAKFGLKADQVASLVGRLSPGERTRAALALLQGRGVNLLVLDEPTNHLDLPAIEQLEEALDSYDGALVLVSHDRRLLDNVSLERRWRVEDGVVTQES